MKMKNGFNMTSLAIALCALCACNPEDVPRYGDVEMGNGVEQTEIERIAKMPNIPAPYKMLDWRQKALEFDSYVFNGTPGPDGEPLIWYYTCYNNIVQETFGIYTALCDGRQGPGVNQNGHEAVTSLPALIGASLLGVDKTTQNGHNYVKMVQNYFNKDNGWNIMMNNVSAGGGDWWYIVFPNVLYYALCDLYPDVDGAEDIQRSIAEQFAKADEVLNGNYDYSYFDYSKMEGVRNNIPYQQDAAGGHAWVLYAAYRKFGDQRYLDRAKSAMDVLAYQPESRFYEILLPMGILTAARMNAEQGTNYNIRRLIDWTFDGCKSNSGRYGWGVIAERWGNYDVYGLQGSTTDGGGYAFFMNTVKLTWPMVPVVKYEPQFADAIGKWMLNAANACRLFYPTEIDDAHQWLPEMKNITNGNIAYEGLRKYDKYGKPELEGVSPVALGDGPQWTSANGDETMFSLYSTAPVGILGALVEKTDVEGIIRIDCNVTDFYADRPYPVYMYYNPYGDDREVTYESSASATADLFDIVSKTYIAKGVYKSMKITVPAGHSIVVVELPEGTRLGQDGTKIVNVADGSVVSYK